MSKRMREHICYLQVLAHCKPKLRKLILLHGSPNLVTCVCECALNVLKGTVPLTNSQKRKLSRYKTHLRQLANKKVSRIRKKSILNQKGGSILSALLPPILETLSNLLLK